MGKINKRDLTEGPIASTLILYAIPIFATGILQTLFTTTDTIVVGRFAGYAAMGGIGATTSLIHLLVNLFLGVSVGVNVLVSRLYGAKDDEGVSETIHTAVLLSIIGGIILALIGVFFSRQFLEWMGTPEDVLEHARLYMTIYFLGMPTHLLYTFGAAILRAVGDSNHPLQFLTISGFVNIILNLILVAGFDFGVAGVAIATVFSEFLSARMVMNLLKKETGALHFSFRKLCIKKDKLLEILRIGIPSGFQSILFSLSNVIIQSSVNSLGSLAVAGNTAAAGIDSVLSMATQSLGHATLSFVSQNVGARKYKRLNAILRTSLTISVSVGIIMGAAVYVTGPFLLSLFTDDPAVISYGMMRVIVTLAPYFLASLQNTMISTVRGLGYAIYPMISSIFCICVYRIIWVKTVFPIYRTIASLYLSYPISWSGVALSLIPCYFFIVRKLKKEDSLRENLLKDN